MSADPKAAMYRFLECSAGQYMTSPAKTVTPQITMAELGTLFDEHDFNSFPVVEDGGLVGIVTKFDFLAVFAFTRSQMVPHYAELMYRRVADVMTEAIVHIDPSAPLTRVLQLMVSLRTRSFPVVDADGRLAGMISREDVMRALREATKPQPTGS
jgi:CBS domain-containing protein